MSSPRRSPEARPEARPEIRPEIRPEPQPETRAGARVGAQPGPDLSRRRAIGLTGAVVAAATGWTLGGAAGWASAADGAAADTADAVALLPRGAGPVHTVQQGHSRITVFALPEQDVTAVWYYITNQDTRARQYKIHAMDRRNRRHSREVNVTVPAGQTHAAALYGSVNHQFDVTLCPDGETCVVVGPVGGVGVSSGSKSRAVGLR